MIIRILGEGQFKIPAEAEPDLQKLDEELEKAVDSDDEPTFRQALKALLAKVRQVGEPVPDEEIDTSDAILPGPDAHVDEVKALLLDDGVIPGWAEPAPARATQAREASAES
jgi:hypothetical protein